MTLGNMRSLGVHSLAVTCELCHQETILGADVGAVREVVEIWMTLSPAFSGYRVMRQRQAFADPS